MIGDLNAELCRIRNEVSEIIKTVNPALKIIEAMIMSTVRLGMIVDKIQKTNEPEERRRLTNEFWQGRNAIDKTIAGYRESLRNGDLLPGQKQRAALP